MKRQPLLCLLGTSLLFGACQINAAENSLFVKTKLLKSSSETRTIAADPTTASVDIMGINSNIIADSTPYLTIQLPGQTKEEKVWLSRFSKTDRGMQVWRGRYNRNVLKNTSMTSLKPADFDSVILVRKGGKVTGTVRRNGQLYRIQPLSNGQHAVIKINEAAVPYDTEHLETVVSEVTYGENDAPDLSRLGYTLPCQSSWNVNMSYPEKGWMVSYNARNYRSRWETKGEIPGVSPVWEPNGTCIQIGEAPAQMALPAPVQVCAAEWTAQNSYPQADLLVSYQGINYRSRNKVAADDVPGINPVWEPQGTCYVPVVPQPEKTTVSVLVAATPAAAKSLGDLEAVAQLAVEETNEGYENSGIDLKLVLAGTMIDPSYVEPSNSSDMLRDLKTTNDNKLEEVHYQRGLTNANIAVLLAKKYGFCGQAYVNARGATAFAVVEASCAVGGYSFGHEIGHLLGGAHNKSSAKAWAYSYGFGWQDPEFMFRTVMAYNCSKNCPRINYYSHATMQHNGKPMGNATEADNTRVLKERKETATTWH